MARRPHTLRRTCTTVGCTETSLMEFDTLRERADYDKRNGTGWLCVRHDKPNEVLSADNPATEQVLTASVVLAEVRRGELRPLSGLFWQAEGERPRSGLLFGPGFRAFAGDFPEGTRLVVSARIELPDTQPGGGEQ